MKSKKTYYAISAFLWLFVGLIGYQLYSLQGKERQTEKQLLTSINEIYQLSNLGLDESELWRKRGQVREIMAEHNHPRGRKLLDTISMVNAIVDSLEMKGIVSFLNIESYYNRSYYNENSGVDDLKPIIKNETFYNQSDLYSLLYKNSLLKTLRKGNNDRYNNIGYICGFSKLPKLQLFDKSKIGLGFDEGSLNIFYTNYPKTKSNSFEFETIVEKLGRNPRTIRTRYKTTPKGDSLGKYDYEKIETIVEK